MSNREEFLKKIQQTFRLEAREGIQNMTSFISELEKVVPPEREIQIVEMVFREAHSLKGASRAVNNLQIESICQSLEGVFYLLKYQKIKLTTGLISLFFEVIGTMEDIIGLPEDQSNAEIIGRTERLILRMKEAENAKKNPSFTADIEGEVPAIKLASPEKQIQPPTTDHPTERPGLTESGKKSIRVEIDKLDELLFKSEEMLTVKAGASHISSELVKIISKFETTIKAAGTTAYNNQSEFFHENIREITHDLKDLRRFTLQENHETSLKIDGLLSEVMKVISVPFSISMHEFQGAVRKLAHDLGKEVALLVSGDHIEIDRRILQDLHIPIIHLLRNSIDHGIELPRERKSAGKSQTATIRLAITKLEENKVEVILSDDGKGIDFEKLKTRFLASSETSADHSKEINEDFLVDYMFSSGVSTTDLITELSGRGLGLAIVKEKIEQLGGTIQVSSKRNAGTEFKIIVPVSIETMRCIHFRVSDQEFVIPTLKVDSVLRLDAGTIKLVDNKAVATIENHILPLAHLKNILNIPGNQRQTAIYTVLMLGVNGDRTGIIVDEIIDEDEFLLKRFNKHIQRIRYYSGATITGNAKVIPLLNYADLLKAVSGKSSLKTAISPQKIRARILVVEDSITSRTLLKDMLELAGYEVITAFDGMDGLNRLREAPFDLVVSDVDMPRMNGFDLTSSIRADAATAQIPVILVTSLSTKEDQERGMEVGANAYILKHSFDKGNLLSVVEHMI
jgi:two-component system chemotaxis sensor kinase CheA